jgi:hypothetical protein
MRKSLRFTLISALLSTALLQAQSLQMVSAKSANQAFGNAFTTTDIKADGVVKNVSNAPVTILVKRIDANYTSLTDSNAICWGLCFTPDVSVSPPQFARTLQPGEESEPGDFSAHVYPDLNGQPESGSITYVFFNMNDETDSVAHTVAFETTVDFSVSELKEDLNLNVYPNPANGWFKINYDLGNRSAATFELVNMVGKTVYKSSLDKFSNQKEVNVAQLGAGVYVYRVKAKGETLLTRKLILK